MNSSVVMNDGTVKVWGDNGYGQLGNGTRTNSLSPIDITSFLSVQYETVPPTIEYVTNGSTTAAQASTSVNITDVGGSLINPDLLKYKWDTQNVTLPTSGWQIYTNVETITKIGIGTYYLWITASDNAGNSVQSVSNPFIIN